MSKLIDELKANTLVDVPTKHLLDAALAEILVAEERIKELETKVVSLVRIKNDLHERINELETKVESREAETLARADEREACAELCIQTWRDAPNYRPEYSQNQLSYGCLASAKAIRARGNDDA